MHVCTIIAKNYVAYARVLARSLAETHPRTRLWVLIIDDFSRHIDPEAEPFSVLSPAGVGCEPFLDMAMRYSVLELSTAVKPWLLRYLLAQTGGPVTYLDPDIQVYGSLHGLDELATEHGVVLTPHNIAPIPQDGRKPSQVDIMIAGIYNLGYVSLAAGDEVDQLLDWWADRLRRDCRVDPIWGYFVDQRWFDLAPGFLSDLAIVRDPEYNVAYWNLHDRGLERGAGGYTANGRPLAFFHFSGFDPAHPLVLSRHQNRIDVTRSPALERILAEYAGAVLDAGHDESRHWPYEFEALGDGTRLNDTLRALYDQFADEHSGSVGSPFTLEGATNFGRWLREPSPRGPAGINRTLAHIYHERPDVRGAFPDLEGEDRAAFLSWAAGTGASQELGLAGQRNGAPNSAARARDGRRLTSAHSAGDAPPLRSGPWGVNLVGPPPRHGELGRVARGMLTGCDAAGVRCLPVTYPGGEATGSLPVNLLCLGPDLLPDYVKHAGPAQFAGRYTAGLWLWPIEALLESWAAHALLLDELWAPSAYVAEALGRAVSVPVHAVPVPVAPDPGVAPAPAKADTSPFVFGHRHELGESAARQNSAAVIEAFTRAFAPGCHARLVIECNGADGTDEAPDRRAELARASDGHPDVTVIDAVTGRLPIAATCHCYVSLHRAQAFGLDMAEAMWWGRPVIATGYSGNLDYMTADNSQLISHRLVAIGAGHDPYPAQAHWAEPDLDDAARVMRELSEHPEATAALGERAARSIRLTHSPEAAGAQLARRLESIRGTGVARRRPDAVLERPAGLAKLPLRIAQGPFPAAPGRGQAARQRLRQAVLGIMKPFTRYQQVVNAELVTAIADLHEALEVERVRADAERADQLAQARQVQRLQARLDWLTALQRGADRR